MATKGVSVKIFALLSGFSGVKAYLAIFGVLFVCGLGVPIPEDITLIAAGFLAYGKNISLIGAMIVGFVGVLVGDVLLFSIGKIYGRRVFKWPGFRRLFTPERITLAEKKIQNNAKLICFTARFLPGLRSAIFLTAGIMKVPFWTFFSRDGLAALISVPLWVYLGFWFGENIEEGLALAKKLQIFILVGVAAVVIYLVWRWKRGAEKKTVLS